ncbi:MAG: histidine--tRNA ligase [Candidatus Tectimicrobiota bacterium]|nr:MAG: histidine--tRNA ligase [Candidatus Tectomicrobia bacterium]
MVSTKPPSGMRDYLPEAVYKRRYVIEVIERVFQRYGFHPLETPAMEHLSTLLGKYGEEGDQLIFRILHRGERLTRALAKVHPEVADLAELGLRYDLTVPLARVVAQYGHALPRIFKRYQIQPVWRADRPAKGRFREFYQCDVDIVGTSSLLAEVEVLNAVSEVLGELGFQRFTIALNHRVLLRSMLEAAGVAAEQEEAALVAIDKLDKIGPAGVEAELRARGLSAAVATRLLAMIGGEAGTDNTERLKVLRDLLPAAPAQAALADLERLLVLTADAPAGPHLRLTPALARGLSYYTGPIFEILCEELRSSLGGGGRYDNLIGMFSGKQVPAVGFSLGLERLLLLMEAEQMFPPLRLTAQVMVCALPDTPLAPVIALATRLRRAGIRADLYPEQSRIGRQLAAADAQGIPYALIVGPDELAHQAYTLKHLRSGEQQTLDEAGLIAVLQQA